MCCLKSGEYEIAIIDLVALLQVNPLNERDGTALIRALNQFERFDEIPDGKPFTYVITAYGGSDTVVYSNCASTAYMK